LPIVLLLACASKPYVNVACDGGTPVSVPRDCSADVGLYVKQTSVGFSETLATELGTVAAEQVVGQQVTQLTTMADQLTVQYQTSLISLCQIQRADPCNADLREQVNAQRLAYQQQFFAARAAIPAAGEALRSGDSAKASAALDEVRSILEANPSADTSTVTHASTAEPAETESPAPQTEASDSAESAGGIAPRDSAPGGSPGKK